MLKRPFRIRSYSLIPGLRNNNNNNSPHELVPSFESDKRFAQAIKRNERRIKEYEDAIELSNQYKQHRSNLINILQDETNVAAMFTDDPRCEITTYEDMCGQVAEQGRLTYNDIEMRNTMMLVANMLMENVVIDLKLRSVKIDHDIEGFIDDIKKSSDFISLEQYRVGFHSYKSSQWLSASNPDTHSRLGSDRPIIFKLNQYDDTEIIQSLETVFNQYTCSTDKLSHIQLALRIIRILLFPHNHIPTIRLWMYLLNKLGNCNLLNYQQTVYLSLFQYKHQPTVLADPSPDTDSISAPLMADHFVHLIEKDPETLIPLLKYQALRKDEKMLLSYYHF